MAILDVQRVDQGEGSSVQYVYNYRSARDVVGPAEQVFTVSITRRALEAFCTQLAAVVDRSYHVGTSGGIDHLAELRVPGGLLHKALFPVLESYLPMLVTRLKQTDELLIRTNDPLVPWELLHDGDTFFGLKYDLSNQSVVGTAVAAGRSIGALRKALLVSDPRADLPESQREADQLAEWLGSHGAGCMMLAQSQASLMRVLSELATGGYDLLHYSGHVGVSEASRDAALLLHGDDALDIRTIRATLSGDPAAEPDGSRGSAPPIVCINGCQAAGRLSNLCSAFMATGSQIVVGTRYAVPEEAARRFAELFYVRLLAGKPAGAAMREARELVSLGVDAAWAAFVLFGDPTARMLPAEREEERAREDGPADEGVEGGGPPAPEPVVVRDEPKPALPEGVLRVFDEHARAALEGAASTGVVTSAHLLVALLLVDDHPLAHAVERAGVAPSRLAGELQPLIEPGPAPDDAAAGESVQLSDTVDRVVASAAELARAAGRELATLADLGQALVEDERGSAAKLLAMLGITARDVAPGAPPEPCERKGPGLVDDRPGSLFDEDGALVGRYLEPSTLAALHLALAIAASQGQMISSYATLLGFGAAGSETLHAALLAQGDEGAALAARFESGRRSTVQSRALRIADFSARVFNALERAGAAAVAAGADLVDDAAVLRELLDEEGSTARELLVRCGVAPDAVVAALRPDHPV